MPEKYHIMNIEYIMETESELYKRLQKSAELDGMTVEELVKWLLTIGSTHVLSERLDRWEYERELVLPEQVGQK